jgi:FkbH-like protein
MSKRKLDLDELLELETRDALRQALQPAATPMSTQIQRITERAAELSPAMVELRLAVVHSYTSELLDPWLAMAGALEGLDIKTYHAPYGLNLEEADAGSGLVAHAPDITLMLLRREDLHPDLTRPAAALSPAEQAGLSSDALERLFAVIEAFRAHEIGHLIISILPQLNGPALGIYDPQSERSEAAWWSALKVDIGCRLRGVAASLFLDLDEVMAQVGRDAFFDPRLWYSARFPFAAPAAYEFSRRVVGLGAALKFPKVKVIALDADNTLWGGIIGEDGYDGIALGHEYPGNAYLAFQRRLLDFQQRGFILALCSKNNPADVEQVLNDHPHQILKPGHFAAIRVNWEPKPDNLVSLAEELNLGLDSFIFVDDSDYECALVCRELPEVEVIRTPARPVDVPYCLDQVSRLEVLSLTAEDLKKTEMYAQESMRRQVRQRAERNGGLEGYLASLEMVMTVRIDDPAPLKRLSQLTQKTNQFNLTTRRYDEMHMRQLIDASDWMVGYFSLKDVFGDSGIVGLALFDLSTPAVAELDTFLMSCRVIGRKAESAFINALLKRLAAAGVREVLADFLPTPKNGLVTNFLPDHGFAAEAGGRFRRDLIASPPLPDGVYPMAVEMLAKSSVSGVGHTVPRSGGPFEIRV